MAGGNIGDRTLAALWVANYYGKDRGHAKLIDTLSYDVNAIMANFCDKAKIDYQMNVEGLDQYKINGVWRDAQWMIDNKQETLDFFDKQLGIK